MIAFANSKVLLEATFHFGFRLWRGEGLNGAGDLCPSETGGKWTGSAIAPGTDDLSFIGATFTSAAWEWRKVFG